MKKTLIIALSLLFVMCSKDNQEKDTFLDLDQVALGKDVPFPDWLNQEWEKENCQPNEFCEFSLEALRFKEDKVYYKKGENFIKFAVDFKNKLYIYDDNDVVNTDKIEDIYFYVIIEKINNDKMRVKIAHYYPKDNTCYGIGYNDSNKDRTHCDQVRWHTYKRK